MSPPVANRTTVTLLDPSSLLITRWFEAPARVVFEAVSRPEHIRRWWAPRSRGEVVSCEADVRVGGAWRNVMRTKHGMEVGFSGTILELDPPFRLVQTEIFDPFPDTVSTVTLTLTEAGARTRLDLVVAYPSAEVRQQVLATGMEDGMRESHDQLTEVVVGLLSAD